MENRRKCNGLLSLYCLLHFLIFQKMKTRGDIIMTISDKASIGGKAPK